jgi:hypothetical protein
MATFYKFGKLFEIPPAAVRLGKSLPANTQAFETFLTNLEPMYSVFITAHPRCPKDPDLPAVRYAIKQFMEEQAPSNFFKERRAASYNPAWRVTYVSWFLGTVAYFLDKLDFTTLVPPPVETEFPVFIAEPPGAPLDPAPPQRNQAPAASSSSAASRNPFQPIAPARPSRQTGPPVPALECRRARRFGDTGGAERRGTPSSTAPTTPKATATGPRPLRAGPGSGGTTPRSGQPDNDIIFLCEDDEDDTNEDSVNQSIQFIRPTGDTNEA